MAQFIPSTQASFCSLTAGHRNPVRADEGKVQEAMEMGNETQKTTREKGRECRYSTSVGSHRQNSPQIEKE